MGSRQVSSPSSPPSARRGSQEPRKRYAQGDVAYSEADDAARVGESVGMYLHPWQHLVIADWCACDSCGRPAYVVCGLDVPRQNGKNAAMEIYELYRLAVCGWHILHTAHRVKTVKKAFNRLAKYFTDDRHPELKRLVASIRRTNGEEAIYLTNGGSIEFIARTNGTARGFDDIQLVVYDEAQELTDTQYDAIAYTLSASATGERQIIYMGTPPNERSAGTVFARTRKAVLDGGLQKMSWNSWSADALPPADSKFADLVDEIYASNPSMGYQLDMSYTEAEFAGAKGNMSGFAHERLGWWSGGSAMSAISDRLWYETAVPTTLVPKRGKKAFGVKFSPDGSTVSLCACRLQEDGTGYVELIGVCRDAAWMPWVAGILCTEQMVDTTAAIAVDGASGAGALLARLAEDYPAQALWRVGTRNMVEASAMFEQALMDRTIAHWDGGPARAQEMLDESALTVMRRPIGRDGGWGYGGDNSTPIEAAVLAFWADKKTRRDPDGECVIL